MLQIVPYGCDDDRRTRPRPRATTATSDCASRRTAGPGPRSSASARHAPRSSMDCAATDPPHVGVLLENVPEYVFLLGGAALAGVAIVGINPDPAWRGARGRHPPHRLPADVDRGTPRCAPRRTGPRDPRGSGDHGRVRTTGPTVFADHVDAVPPRQLPPPETLWVLIFTSGSTGAPKAVRGTQASLRALRRVDAVHGRRRAVLPDAAVPRQCTRGELRPGAHERRNARDPTNVLGVGVHA